MARKRQSFAEDLVDIVATLPWWIGIVLAIASYFLMHWLATHGATSVTGPHPSSEIIGDAITRGLTLGGQFLLPAIFLIGAAISAFRNFTAPSDSEIRKSDPVWNSNGYSNGSLTSMLPERDRYEEWKEVLQSPSGDPPVAEDEWSLALLKRLEWKRFEHVCARYFEELGFRTQVARAGADGGVDIRLFAKDSRAPGILVQCKAWRNVHVGVNVVRELLGVLTADNVAEGILVTTGTFTPDARQFASGKNIHLIDGEDLLRKLFDLPVGSQASLLHFATEGDYFTPTCPSCGEGTRMQLRRSSRDGSLFWGCANFPRCRTTMQMPRSAEG